MSSARDLWKNLNLGDAVRCCSSAAPPPHPTDAQPGISVHNPRRGFHPPGGFSFFNYLILRGTPQGLHRRRPLNVLSRIRQLEPRISGLSARPRSRPARTLLQQPVLNGIADQIGVASQAKLLQQAGPVGADGFVADTQFDGNLFQCLPTAQGGKDRKLAFG